MKYIKDFFKYSLDFVGVANRKEFWIPMLCVIALHLVCTILAFFVSWFLIVEAVVCLALCVPTLSILARRLHDTDRSAYNLFWILFPFVGTVILLVYLLEKTQYNVE